MILGCFFSPTIAAFVERHPALLRAERSFSLSALRFLFACVGLGPLQARL